MRQVAEELVQQQLASADGSASSSAAPLFDMQWEAFLDLLAAHLSAQNDANSTEIDEESVLMRILGDEYAAVGQDFERALRDGRLSGWIQRDTLW